MAEQKIHTLSEETIAKLRADHDRLAAIVVNLGTRVGIAERAEDTPETILLAKTTSVIPAYDTATETPGSGTAKVWRWETALAESTREETVYNFAARIESGVLVAIKRHFQRSLWMARPVGLGYDRCRALNKGNVDAADSTFIVDNVVATRGDSPVTDASDELTVTKDFSYSAADNAVVYIEWQQQLNGGAGGWAAYAAEIVCEDVP